MTGDHQLRANLFGRACAAAPASDDPASAAKANADNASHETERITISSLPCSRTACGRAIGAGRVTPPP